jgi:hypothetical protein
VVAVYQDRHQQRRRGRRLRREADGDDERDAVVTSGTLVQNAGATLYAPCLELVEDMHGALDVFDQLDRERDDDDSDGEGDGAARSLHLWHTALHPGNILIDGPDGPASDPVISAVLDW